MRCQQPGYKLRSARPSVGIATPFLPGALAAAAWPCPVQVCMQQEQDAVVVALAWIGHIHSRHHDMLEQSPWSLDLSLQVLEQFHETLTHNVCNNHFFHGVRKY